MIDFTQMWKVSKSHKLAQIKMAFNVSPSKDSVKMRVQANNN